MYRLTLYYNVDAIQIPVLSRITPWLRKSQLTIATFLVSKAPPNAEEPMGDYGPRTDVENAQNSLPAGP